MGNKFQMLYCSVEEGESLSYTPHHLGMMQQSSRHWTQEHPSFCSQLVTGVNFFPFPFHHLCSQSRQSSEPFALPQTPTGMYVLLSILMLTYLKMDEAAVLLPGSELLLTQN